MKSNTKLCFTAYYSPILLPYLIFTYSSLFVFYLSSTAHLDIFYLLTYWFHIYCILSNIPLLITSSTQCLYFFDYCLPSNFSNPHLSISSSSPTPLIFLNCFSSIANLFAFLLLNYRFSVLCSSDVSWY